MPAKPRTALKEASEVRFPTWDEMVAEATIETGPYKLPMPDGEIIEIPVFDGDTYLEIIQAQRTGDAGALFELLFPDRADQTRVRKAMKGAHFAIIDVLSAKVLRHFYGLSIETEEQEGNSPAS